MEAGLGRGGIWAGLGRGPGWLIPKGLLPPLRGGRWPPERGVFGACGAAARFAAGEPGRGGTTPGPGLKLGPGLAVGGSVVGRCRACCAALTAASCSALSAAARASAAATSMSWALAGLTGGVAGGAGAFLVGGGAAFRGGAGFADTLGAPGLAGGAGVATGVGAGAGTGTGAGAGVVPASRATRSLRATGASTVLDADLTNSPISFSLASTVLLSTPSSFASSCTRALPATALLTPRPRGQVPASTSHPHLKPGHFSDFIVCSCRSSYLAELGGAITLHRR